MNDSPLNRLQCDVAIVGGGPAGLAAAVTLKQQGIGTVIVFERESDAGGIPRHCGHPPFGLREFRTLLTGPQYAKRLVDAAMAANVDIRTSHTVAKMNPGAELLISAPKGLITVSADRVILATGVREQPRSARLVSGRRPLGILNTGALQSMIYLKGRTPFKRPVIVGSELVSFSALWTCCNAGIRPVAMIDDNPHVLARWPSRYFPALVGVPLHLQTKIVDIDGDRQVTGVTVQNASGHKENMSCDGVLFTGKFTPEASLARSGHLHMDTASGGPVIDQYGRCSDPVYFATGNVLRPVETAGWSWNEGRQCGQWVANDLGKSGQGSGDDILVTSEDPDIKYVMPQKITLADPFGGMANIQLRVTKRREGTLVVRAGDTVLFRQKLDAFPERRILVPLDKLQLTSDMAGAEINLAFEE